MSAVYPHADPRWCKALFWPRNASRPGQCGNRPGIGGWCSQHHPDAEEARGERKRTKLPNVVRLQVERNNLLAALHAILAIIPEQEPLRPGQIEYSEGCIPAVVDIARRAIEEVEA